MTPPRPAATVVVLRDGAAGPEVFLTQRARGVGFMPSAWVFPGGRVEPSDDLSQHPHVGGGEAAARFWGVSRAVVVPWLVAAVRETLEEVGIWLGNGTIADEAREALVAGRRALGDVLLSTGATVDLDRLVPWSWWVTPEVEPKRYDTRFLLVIGDAVAGPLQEGEAVAARWVRPADALAAAEAGTLPLAPPTWWTLQELAAFPSTVDAARASRPSRPIQPIADLTDGFVLRLPGDAAHPEPAIPGLPTQIRFDLGRWWARD